MSSLLPTMLAVKAEARALRKDCCANGNAKSHSQTLEQVAQGYGFRDWNSFHAAINQQGPGGFTPRCRVNGHFMSQAFTATLTAIQVVRPGWHRLDLKLDSPIDVVTFDSFSNFRRRVRAVVGPAGESQERTSDGIPHLSIDGTDKLD